MSTYLAPIERPQGLLKKIVYALSRRQFGKVPTPVKVVYARLPVGFGMFVGKISKLDKELSKIELAGTRIECGGGARLPAVSARAAQSQP